MESHFFLLELHIPYPFKLSDGEAALYKSVTEYVREEFNRVEALENDTRAGTVGFALTILQRRLASSPEAIYMSIQRRKKRLESKLRELELLQRGGAVSQDMPNNISNFDEEDIEDKEDAIDDGSDQNELEIIDQATAAQSIEELRIEIETLSKLETQAAHVRRNEKDTKWCELADLIEILFKDGGSISQNQVVAGLDEDHKPKSSKEQKLVIFTEHKDTLTYLKSRIETVLGEPDAIVIIHGGIAREDRLKSQRHFVMIRT